MRGLNLRSIEDILTLHDFHNSGGRWKPFTVSLMDDYSANVILDAEVSCDFGGPYFDSREGKGCLEVPLNIQDFVLSWHLLALGVFDSCGISCSKYNETRTRETTYIKNREGFEDLFRSGSKKGKKFVDMICSKYEAFVGLFFEEDRRFGIKYNPRRSHNKTSSALDKGDKLIVAADFWHPNWVSDGDFDRDVFKNFDERGDGMLVVPSRNVKGFLPRYF